MKIHEILSNNEGKINTNKNSNECIDIKIRFLKNFTSSFKFKFNIIYFDLSTKK